MDHESEVIKQQMEQTRASLAEKLDTLEEHVTTTVRNTTDAVAGTVEAVKETVESTVDSVKGAVENTVNTVSESVENVKETVVSTFDLNRHMQQHPWLMLGGGVLAGYLGGCLLTRSAREETRSGMISSFRSPATSSSPSATTPSSNFSGMESHGNGHERGSTASTAAATPSGPSTWDRLAETFAPTAEKVKELALGAAAGLVGRMILDAVPPTLRGEVEQVVNEFTQAVGGKTLPSVLHPNPAESRASAPPARS
jgi:ElaB/YqjD/DUF883 family membrane-anchored ribosome-binding protein